MEKKITLCNIYAPNDQANQLQFIQELNNCIIDKTELVSLIVGGDWNWTLTKKDKMVGAPWKSTVYCNLISTGNYGNVRLGRYPKSTSSRTKKTSHTSPKL